MLSVRGREEEGVGIESIPKKPKLTLWKTYQRLLLGKMQKKRERKDAPRRALFILLSSFLWSTMETEVL